MQEVDLVETKVKRVKMKNVKGHGVTKPTWHWTVPFRDRRVQKQVLPAKNVEDSLFLADHLDWLRQSLLVEAEVIQVIKGKIRTSTGTSFFTISMIFLWWSRCCTKDERKTVQGKRHYVMYSHQSWQRVYGKVISRLCGATDTLALDLSCRLRWVSKPEWTFSILCFLAFAWWIFFLVRHLPNSWRLAWQPIFFTHLRHNFQVLYKLMLSSHVLRFIWTAAWSDGMNLFAVARAVVPAAALAPVQSGAEAPSYQRISQSVWGVCLSRVRLLHTQPRYVSNYFSPPVKQDCVKFRAPACGWIHIAPIFGKPNRLKLKLQKKNISQKSQPKLWRKGRTLCQKFNLPAKLLTDLIESNSTLFINSFRTQERESDQTETQPISQGTSLGDKTLPSWIEFTGSSNSCPPPTHVQFLLFWV